MLEPVFDQSLGEPEEVRRLEKGDFLFRRGDSAKAVFLVKEGRVRLERILESGSPVTLFTARAGDGLAEAALFSEAYHCDAIAEVASRVAAFSKQRVLQALAENPLLGQRLMARMAHQVRDLRALLELRNIRSAQERILQYLRLVGWLHGGTEDRPAKALAAEVGLTPEAFYRALSALEKKGQIRRRGRALEVIESQKT